MSFVNTSASSSSSGSSIPSSPFTSSPGPSAARATILCGLKSGEFVLVEKADTSSVWKSFAKVCCTKTKQPSGYVQCRNCFSLYTFKTGSATTQLKRHDCSNARHASSTDTEKPAVPRSTKNEVRDSCVDLCGRDLRPFNNVEGKGFKGLCQLLVNVGAKHGEVDVKDLLPSRTTVARHVADIADNLRAKFVPEVKAAINERCCSIDMDLWTDRYTKTNHLTAVAQ